MEAYVISGLGKGPRRHSVIIHQGQYTHFLKGKKRNGQARNRKNNRLSHLSHDLLFIITESFVYICLLLLLKMTVRSDDCVPLKQLLRFLIS